jgi:hypothetical protein
MHGGPWSERKAWDVCERHAAFGVPLHFTETTVVSGAKNRGGRQKTTADGERKQAEAVERFYKLLFSHPAVEAITWWDFSDQGAWQGAPSGLLREDMTPKPAYDRLLEVIKKEWWTRNEVTVADDGRVECRGFLGDYRVAVGDSRLRGTFRLAAGGGKKLTIKMSES